MSFKYRMILVLGWLISVALCTLIAKKKFLIFHMLHLNLEQCLSCLDSAKHAKAGAIAYFLKSLFLNLNWIKVHTKITIKLPRHVSIKIQVTRQFKKNCLQDFIGVCLSLLHFISVSKENLIFLSQTYLTHFPKSSFNISEKSFIL